MFSPTNVLFARLAARLYVDRRLGFRRGVLRFLVRLFIDILLLGLRLAAVIVLFFGARRLRATVRLAVVRRFGVFRRFVVAFLRVFRLRGLIKSISLILLSRPLWFGFYLQLKPTMLDLFFDLPKLLD